MSQLPIYNGSIQANRVGAFVKQGMAFDVIRPGYCIQGTRRPTWTQVVFQGVPVFEIKTSVSLTAALDRFDRQWDSILGGDADLAGRALAACRKSRLEKFRDGVTAETFAPSVTQHGKGQGLVYPT